MPRILIAGLIFFGLASLCHADFVTLGLDEAIDGLAKSTPSLNVIFDAGSKAKVTLRLDDDRPMEVLAAIVAANRLVIDRSGSIVTIGKRRSTSLPSIEAPSTKKGLSLSARRIPVVHVLRQAAQEAGVKLLLCGEISAQVSLRVTEVPPMELLHGACKTAGLNCIPMGSCFCITAGKPPKADKLRRSYEAAKALLENDPTSSNASFLEEAEGLSSKLTRSLEELDRSFNELKARKETADIENALQQNRGRGRGLTPNGRLWDHKFKRGLGREGRDAESRYNAAKKIADEHRRQCLALIGKFKSLNEMFMSSSRGEGSAALMKWMRTGETPKEARARLMQEMATARKNFDKLNPEWKKAVHTAETAKAKYERYLNK